MVGLFQSSLSASDLLLSYKAHQGWCANAQFVNNNNNVLATAGGMDGTVALWNVASVEALKQLHVYRPETRTYDAGVFSLNVFNENSIFTASKDRSICSSRITEDGQLKVLRRFDKFHSGVVKCVKAKSEDVFAYVWERWYHRHLGYPRFKRETSAPHRECTRWLRGKFRRMER